MYNQPRFFNYLLSLIDTLSNLVRIESVLILLICPYAKKSLYAAEGTLEQWNNNCFGAHFYRTQRLYQIHNQIGLLFNRSTKTVQRRLHDLPELLSMTVEPVRPVSVSQEIKKKLLLELKNQLVKYTVIRCLAVNKIHPRAKRWATRNFVKKVTFDTKMCLDNLIPIQ